MLHNMGEYEQFDCILTEFILNSGLMNNTAIKKFSSSNYLFCELFWYFFLLTNLFWKKKGETQSKRKIHLILQNILRFFLVSMKTFLGIFRHSLFFKHHAGQNDFNFQHFQKFTKYRSDKPANNLPEPLPIVSVLHGPGSYSLWTEFMIFRSALSFSWIVIYLKIHVTVVCVLKSQWVMQVLHWHLRITSYYVFISFQ